MSLKSNLKMVLPIFVVLGLAACGSQSSDHSDSATSLTSVGATDSITSVIVSTTESITTNPSVSTSTSTTDPIDDVKYDFTIIVDSAKATVTGSGQYEEGEQVTAVVTPNDGYVIDGWYEGAAKKSNDLSYTFTMPASNYELEVKLDEHEIKYLLNGIVYVELTLKPLDSTFSFCVVQSMGPQEFVINVEGKYEVNHEVDDEFITFTELVSIDAKNFAFGQLLPNAIIDMTLSIDEFNNIMYVTSDYLLLEFMNDFLIYIPLAGEEIPDVIPEIPSSSNIELVEVQGYYGDALGAYGANIDIGMDDEYLISMLDFNAVFSDGRVVNIWSNSLNGQVTSVSGVDYNTPGFYMASVNFTYGGADYSCEILVRVGIGRYDIWVNSPTNNYITLGTTIEEYAASIMLNMQNHESGEFEVDIPVTSEMISGFDSSQEGQFHISITCEIDEVTFQINVELKVYDENNPGISSISSSESIYFISVGQELSNLEDEYMYIAWYDDNYKEISFSSDEIEFSDFDNEAVGAYLVKLTHNDIFIEVLVVVHNDQEKPIDYVRTSPIFVNVVDGEYILMGDEPEIGYCDGSFGTLTMDKDFFAGLDNITLVDPIELNDMAALQFAMMEAMYYGKTGGKVYIYEYEVSVAGYEYSFYIPIIFVDNLAI